MKFLSMLLVGITCCLTAEAQEPPTKPSSPSSCLVIANVLTAGTLLYRDSYNVPLQHLKLSYSREELESIMHTGVKVVIYDQDRETLGEARESCATNSIPVQDARK